MFWEFNLDLHMVKILCRGDFYRCKFMERWAWNDTDLWLLIAAFCLNLRFGIVEFSSRNYDNVRD